MKLIAAILSVFLFAGCNPVKKVLKNKADFNEIGKAWAAENPCANDTTIITKPGRIDSIPYPVPVVDAALLNHKADSITRAIVQKYGKQQAECDTAIRESFNVGFQQATIMASLAKVPVQRPDTIQKIIVDIRERDLLKNDKDILTNDKFSLLSQLVVQKAETGKMKRQRTVAYLITGISGLLLIIMIILYFKK